MIRYVDHPWMLVVALVGALLAAGAVLAGHRRRQARLARKRRTSCFMRSRRLGRSSSASIESETSSASATSMPSVSMMAFPCPQRGAASPTSSSRKATASRRARARGTVASPGGPSRWSA